MNQLERLTEKMTAEFDGYRSWLLKQPPEEILNHAYEYTTKENLLNVLGDTDLKPQQIETLLRSPCPLEDVFKDCSYIDQSDYNYTLKVLIDQRADIEMEKQRAIPIYNGTAREAKERGELDKFKDSAKADENCKTAIENAIARNYDGTRLNTNAAIREVREQFGEKRLTRVTASLIVNRPHDERISPENMKWAEKNATTKKAFTDRTHSGLLDIFATRLRESERKRERGAER
jgi:hypothetical protein